MAMRSQFDEVLYIRDDRYVDVRGEYDPLFEPEAGAAERIVFTFSQGENRVVGAAMPWGPREWGEVAEAPQSEWVEGPAVGTAVQVSIAADGDVRTHSWTREVRLERR